MYQCQLDGAEHKRRDGWIIIQDQLEYDQGQRIVLIFTATNTRLRYTMFAYLAVTKDHLWRARYLIISTRHAEHLQASETYTQTKVTNTQSYFLELNTFIGNRKKPTGIRYTTAPALQIVEHQGACSIAFIGL